MKNKWRSLLIAGSGIISMLILVQSLRAQAGREPRFLDQTGLLDSLYSETLREYRDIYVQLPDSYDPERPQKYPVVYLLDGEVFLPATKIVLDYYSGGFMPEMVLVGISNNINRMRDLTTSTIDSMYGRPFRQRNGEAENFLRFIEDELIPFVEDTYPVTSYRTITGHSYGGLFAIHSLLFHSDLFANYIAIDPSLDWDDQSLLEQSNMVLSTEDFTGKSLFVSLGGQLHMQDPEVTLENVMSDSSEFTLFARSNIAFADLVRQNTGNGLYFEWKFYPRDLHGTIALPSIMDGLISVFEWYQMEHTSRFNSFDTPKEELYEIVKYRESKLQSHFGYLVPPYPEELLIVLGMMSSDMQQSEKAKMFFDFAIEYYPRSMDAYDAMVDFCINQEDDAAALEYATKAYELSGSEDHKRRMDRLKKKN